MHNKIYKNYIEEKEIIMSLNNNNIEIILEINNNKILFILESKEIKLDIKIINKINEYIDILIKKQDNNENNLKELKNEIGNIKKELNNKIKEYENDIFKLIDQKNNNEKKILKNEMEKIYIEI